MVNSPLPLPWGQSQGAELGAKLKPSRLPLNRRRPKLPRARYFLLFWEGAAVPFLTQARDRSHSPPQFPTGVFDFSAPMDFMPGHQPTSRP